MLAQERVDLAGRAAAGRGSQPQDGDPIRPARETEIPRESGTTDCMRPICTYEARAAP